MIDDLDSLALLTKDNPFKAITGKTQGIKFKIRPPKKAKITAVKIPIVANSVDDCMDIVSLTL